MLQAFPFRGIRLQWPGTRLCLALFLLFAATACSRRFTVHRAMKWSPLGSGVALAFVCAPNQRVILESPDLLSSLQNSGRVQVDVEFEVTGSYFSDAKSFDIQAIDGDRTGTWRTAGGGMEGRGESGSTSVDPFGPLCN